jgi:hypothetical protein
MNISCLCSSPISRAVLTFRYCSPRTRIPCRYPKWSRSPGCQTRMSHPAPYGHRTPYLSPNGILIRGHTRFPCSTLAGLPHRTAFESRMPRLSFPVYLWTLRFLQSHSEKFRRWSVVRQKARQRK